MAGSRPWHPGTQAQPRLPVSAGMAVRTSTSPLLFWALGITGVTLVGLIVTFIVIKPPRSSQLMSAAPAKVVNLPIPAVPSAVGDTLKTPPALTGGGAAVESKTSPSVINQPNSSDPGVSAAPEVNLAAPKTPPAAGAEIAGPRSDPNAFSAAATGNTSPPPTRQDLAASSHRNAAVPQPEPPTDPVADKSIPKLTDSGLILQALAWSPDPLRRMAVINDLIVREGSTISGYTVKHITADDVMVAQGNRVWRLAFAMQ